MLLYHDFARTLASRVRASLDTIETGNNLEYGVEFEFALCEAFRSALPDRYGIARGYVVDAKGTTAGDDIFLYARERFPTLAMRHRDDFARKEFIPIEAAYCYIEAKHSVHINGEDRQSLRYACEQVSRVKALCSQRSPVKPNQVAPYLTIGDGISAGTPRDFPETLNPMYTAVFARHVRPEVGKAPCVSGADVERLLSGWQFSTTHAPDLLVLGESLVVLPTLPGSSGTPTYRSPFFIEGRSSFCTRVVDGLAFGIGLASVLSALDWIQLGVLPWHKILIDALGIPP